MNQYMKIAKEFAASNLESNAGGPFGACVVKDGKIVGKGSNHVLKNNDPTAHSEIVAIREACKNLNTFDLSGCEIYSSSYPCPMCLSAIMWANIKKVYYGNTKEDTAKIGFRDDFIYDYIDKIMYHEEDEEVLKLIQLDYQETIKEYEKYMQKEDRQLY